MAATELLDPAVRPRLEALIERNHDRGCVNLSELTELAESLELDEDGTRVLQEAAEEQGFEVTDDCGRSGSEEPTRLAFSFKETFKALDREAVVPGVAHWHVTRGDPLSGRVEAQVLVVDPHLSLIHI